MSAEPSDQSPTQAQVTQDYIRGFREGLAKGNPAEGSQPLPYKRWFTYLLIGTLLTIIPPLFADSKDSFFQTSSILTFTMVNGDMQPTSEKIWVDGRTYALLTGRFSLYFFTGAVLLETIILILSKLARRVK